MLRQERANAQMDERGAPSGAGVRSEGFDLKEKIRVVNRRRRIIIATTLLITGIVALIALSLPPRYTTVASVLIEQRKTNVIDTESVVEESRADSSALVAEIKLLRSTTYAEKVIEELDLLSSPGFNPTLQDRTGHLAILAGRVSALWNRVPESWRVAISSRFPDQWLVAVGIAQEPQALSPSGAGLVEVTDTASEPPSMPSPDSEAYESLMQTAVRTLLAGLQIRAGGSNLILIEATSSDAQQAAAIADTVAKLYVQDQLEIRRQAVVEAVDWLKERVDNLRARVLESEGAVVTYQEQHGLASTATPRPESGPGQELVRVRAERTQKQELLEWVQGLRNRGAGLETIAAVLSLPSLAALRDREMELQREEAMLRTKYGAQHREILQLEAARHPINIEREHLVASADREIRAAIRKLEGEIAFAERQEADLEQRLAQTVEQPDTGSARAEVQLRDLQRQADADRSLYVAFLNRFKEVSEQQNLLEAGAQVGSRAGIPGDPEFPKPGLMTAAGFTVSLTFGMMLAFLVEFLDSGLRTGRQVERVLGLPNLGFVPSVANLNGHRSLHRYLIAKPRSAYTEAIRRVQIATMDAADAEQGGLVVLVTSSLPGEGKTTLALSLGASAACSGRKAVAVDLDLRRPRLHSETDLKPDAGIIELLAGDRTLDEVICAGRDHPRLDILPVSALARSPADLVRSPQLAALLKELRARYDYIVLDSPPLLGVVDAKLVARLADAVLFVARWEKTNETAARTGLDNLVDHHTPPIGAVLTQVDVRRHAKRGYGESVQYYSKYAAYYK